MPPLCQGLLYQQDTCASDKDYEVLQITKQLDSPYCSELLGKCQFHCSTQLLYYQNKQTRKLLPWPGGSIDWCRPRYPKAAGLIPGQGTHLGFRFNPERQRIDVSLSHQCLSVSLSHWPPLTLYNQFLKKHILTWAGVAQCIEHQPVNWQVAGSTPSQGTCLSCRPGPGLGAL